MKKLTTILIAIMLVTSLAITAYAASTTYTVSELDLSLDIPSEYLTFTRETEENDPLLAELGISAADLIAYLESEDIYLDAIHPEGIEELIVSMTDNEINNFEEIGDDALLTMIPAMEEEYSNYGIAVSGCEIYHHAQVPFFRIYFNTEDNSTYALQYYTIYDHKAMNFTLYSYTGPISEAQEIAMQNIVDTIFLNSYVPAEITPAFEYTDPNTGTTFTVPANWSAQETTIEDAMTAIELTHAKYPALCITYTSAELPSFWKPIYALGGDAIKEMLLDPSTYIDWYDSYGITESAVSQKTYNGRTYALVEIPFEAEIGGVVYPGTLTAAHWIENDLLYIFIFRAEQSNPFFADFEQMLKTVEYGDVVVSSGNSSNSTSSGSGTGIGIVIALVIFIAIPAIVLCIVFSAKKKKKKKAAAAQNQVSPADTSAQGYIYCQYCGVKLPSDSTFCHICGNRL